MTTRAASRSKSRGGEAVALSRRVAPTSQRSTAGGAAWTDPDFDPERPTVYYARVVENPTCRWSAWRCLSLPPEERPDGCADARVLRTIQERAWTSPIWYLPEG